MKIRFTDEDWDRIEREWSLFWEGEQKRPMVLIECWDNSTEPVQERESCIPQYPREMSAEEVIDIETRHFEGIHFFGDAFPKFFMNFGPGSSAVYFGSNSTVQLDTVWFEATNKELEEISFEIDRENYWYKRTHAILDAALNKWIDLIQVTFTDIGGNLDILASLRGSHKLLIDLYENDEILAQRVRELTSAWLEIYQEEGKKIQRVSHGTASWGPLFSLGTTYMLQSDFSYMISPEMFELFVLPDLTTCCDFLDDPFYHLDGKGQLPHLDMILSIEKLKGVQWIPGEGQPEPEDWMDILKKIRDGGKFCQVYVLPEGALRIKNDLGGEGFVFCIETGKQILSVADAQSLFNELVR
jgi:5-methyltetrahydrofolate--homocysteine methyltransferase